ncbi:uncharacterized protein M6B38_302645 [Iris pallida]|uniref:DUF7906 domain-containing protein n=1 Tax=Iris pallida TaxID=29817 RepID=A0AAX6HMD3_IRIPA|nr:uncharacterized protein M6B38_302645 [Iris pallida]
MPSLRLRLCLCLRLLVVLFLSLSFLPSSLSLPTIGLDAFLSEQSRLDPAASKDTYTLLPPSLKRSFPLSSPLLPPLPPLPSLQIPIPLHVRLVGPSFSSSSPSLLSSFVAAAAAHSSSHFHSISASGPSHSLAVSHSLHLHPSLSPLSLSNQITSAISSHLDSSPSPLHRSSLHPVPYSLVDRIVRADFLSQSPSASPPGALFLYLLYPDLPPTPKPYAYSYDQQNDTTSPALSKCLGSIWTARDRYVWIDLAAGPVDYGPAHSGDGLLPRGDFHPLAALHRKHPSSSERALLADLASLVLSAYRTLLVPSLRIPVHFEDSLLVRFVHVRGNSHSPDLAGLDFASIERSIRDGDLEFKGHQELKFKSYSVEIDDCPVCSFAVSRALSSYTSRFLFENYTLTVSEYLDSKRLRQVLSDSADDIRGAAGIGDEESGKVLPVYIFDLDYDKAVLLDRFHQAVAFRDMVVAIRTRASHMVSDYICNGRHVITQARMLDRAVVGSVLQSMWGVSPTHLSWSEQHNSTLVDYTWSVGQTPFGPFSDSSALSFVQRDAAKRSVLLTTMNYTISSVIDIFESVAAHGGDKMLIKNNKHLEFVQRWNFLSYKLDKVVSAMSHLDFDKAMYFLRSSEHDLYAIHNIVYLASQELEASLECFKDPPFPWASVSVAGVFVFGFLYAYAKRDKIFRSKRKQF